MNKHVYTADQVFAELLPADEKILVSLPYRIGLFVSYADVTGGWDAQDQELHSLASILREFSEDLHKTDFTQKVLMDCILDRGQWPSWSKRIDTVPDEIGRTVSLLTPMLKDKDLTAFKAVLIDIAVAVAMAFKEEENEGQGADAARKGGVRNILTHLTGVQKTGDPLSHINISANEKTAILRLTQALQYVKP